MWGYGALLLHGEGDDEIAFPLRSSLIIERCVSHDSRVDGPPQKPFE